MSSSEFSSSMSSSDIELTDSMETTDESFEEDSSEYFDVEGVKRPLTEFELLNCDISEGEKIACPKFDTIFHRFFNGLIYPFRAVFFVVQHFLCWFIFVDILFFVAYIVFLILLGFVASFLISWGIVFRFQFDLKPYPPLFLFLLMGLVGGITFTVVLFVLSYFLCVRVYFFAVFKRLSNIVEQIQKGGEKNLPLYYRRKSGVSSPFSCKNCLIAIFMCPCIRDWLIEFISKKLVVLGFTTLIIPIPVVGQIAIFVVMITTVGISSFSAVFERKNFSSLQRIRWGYQNFAVIFGIGLTTALIYLIFPFNALYFCIADVCGTLCLNHIEYRRNPNSEKPNLLEMEEIEEEETFGSYCWKHLRMFLGCVVVGMVLVLLIFLLFRANWKIEEVADSEKFV